MKTRRELSKFIPPKLRIKTTIRIGLWFAFQQVIFKSPLLPSVLRSPILRIFGASIGHHVLIRRGVRIHFPWNLSIGDHCWIGEEVWFINHDKITIGSNVCISQRAIICSSGHDYRSSSLEYSHKPIQIKDGAWVCLDAKVLAGVSLGECSVVSAGEIVRKSIPDYSLLLGGEVKLINPPK
jgi:putative colanic acid biosynthesis acetyltransferase WcaF